MYNQRENKIIIKGWCTTMHYSCQLTNFCFAVLNTIYILYGSFIGNTQLMLLIWDFDAGHVLSH